MPTNNDFIAEMQQKYSFNVPSLCFGAARLNDEVYAECPVAIPLKTLNRHGLIAGATGTGKTKTLQVIAEGLSDQGIPSVMLDIKGDLSGLGAAGEKKDFLLQRYKLLNKQYEPEAYPVEFFSMSGDKGARLRATVIEFGPVLLSKILELNDTQQGLLAVLFKFADDHHLPILDLKDLSELVKYATENGKKELEATYGKLSSQSLGIILRKIVELQQQGADHFFGELSFDVHDLMRTDLQGKGYLNIIRVTDLQDKPKLFSSFMLQMLAELYNELPEAGDLEKPKLILFIDEAHLLFKEASKALLSQIENVIKLIRSKGVGVFFCTQNPMDVPPVILSQLGLKVQHSLRAFTANDRKAIKQTAENYPLSDYYKTDQLLTELGIGEAIITGLNEKGVPTPLAHTFLLSPKSRMDILSDTELDVILSESSLVTKYATVIDRESAYEILSKRIQLDTAPQNKTADRGKKVEKSWVEQALNSSAGKQVQRSLVRTAFDVLQRLFK